MTAIEIFTINYRAMPNEESIISYVQRIQTSRIEVRYYYLLYVFIYFSKYNTQVLNHCKIRK